jgi:hypothetical protein
MMKSRIGILLLCSVFASAAAAQKAPSDVTETQIKGYKANALKQCTDAGKSRGDPAEKVDGFCNCMIATLEKSVSREEWQKLTFYSSQGRQKEEINVLGPHAPKIKDCAAPPKDAPAPALRSGG